MRKKLTKTLFVLALQGLLAPAWASHGPLATTERDAWINKSAETLVQDELAPKPSKPISELTNLEIAQLTHKAVEIIVAQADLGLPPALPGAEPSLPGAEPDSASGSTRFGSVEPSASFGLGDIRVSGGRPECASTGG